MKHIYIILLAHLLPITSFAANSVTGTTDSGNGSGTLEDNGQIFNVLGKKLGGLGGKPTPSNTPPDIGLFGSSIKTGQWWVATNSNTPWDTYVPHTAAGNNPAYHMTEDVVGGEDFYVGLSSEFEMLSFTTEFRMVGANDIFSEDVDIYFGLKSLSASSPPNSTYITGEQGITYVDDTGPSGASFASEFEWIHYTSNSTTGTGDILLDFIAIDALTEWVVYFETPLTMATIDNEEWTDTPPATADDLTFSWTISPQGGYTGWDGPNGDFDPDVIIGWDTPSFSVVPEPSSAFLLIGGVGLMLLQRRRSAA